MAERGAENGVEPTSTVVASGAARLDTSESANRREGIIVAFVLGWHMAELFHANVPRSAQRRQASLDKLVGVGDLDPLSQAKLLLAQVQVDLQRIWRLIDSDHEHPDPAPVQSLLEADARPPGQFQAAMAELHEELLVALTAADFRMGKAYELGRGLAETALLPDAKNPQTFQRMFARDQLSNLLRWLADLESAFPLYSAEAVRGSLQAWAAWSQEPMLRRGLDVGRGGLDPEVDGQVHGAPISPTPPFGRATSGSRLWLARAPQPQASPVDWESAADRARVTRALHRQGQQWRAVLSGEIAVGKEPEWTTANIPSAALWMILVLAVVLGGALLLVLWRTGLALGRSDLTRWAVWVLAIVGFAFLVGAIRAAVRAAGEMSAPAILATHEAETGQLYLPSWFPGQPTRVSAFDGYLQSRNLHEMERTPGVTHSRVIVTPGLLAARKELIAHAWLGAAGTRVVVGMVVVVLSILLLAPGGFAQPRGGLSDGSPAGTSSGQTPTTTVATGRPGQLPLGMVDGVAAGVAPILVAGLAQPLVQVAAAAASTPADVKKLVLEDVARPFLRAGSTKLGDALGGTLAQSVKLTPSQQATAPSAEAVAQVQHALEREVERNLNSRPELAAAAAKVGRTPNQLADELAVTISQELASDIAQGLLEIPASATLDQSIVTTITRGVAEQRVDQMKQGRSPPPLPTPAAPPPDSEPPSPDGRFYTVRSGDSLWNITRRLLGSQATSPEVDQAWRKIYRANRAAIGPNPNRIVPGQKLVVPNGPKAATREAWSLSWFILATGATTGLTYRTRRRHWPKFAAMVSHVGQIRRGYGQVGPR